MALTPDYVVVFDVNGERKRLDYRKLSFSAWAELKQHLGFTPITMLSGVREFDITAFAALIWLERKQQNRNLGWAQMRLDFEQQDFTFQLVDIIINGRSSNGLSEEELEGLRREAAELDPTTSSGG